MAEFKASKAHKSLFQALLWAKGKYGGKTVAIVDADDSEYSYNQLVQAAFALGSALRRHTKKGENVGLMLPTGVGVAIGFFSLHAYGRVPTMINFTAGRRNILAGMKAAGVTKIVTAHKFIEMAELGALEAHLSDHAELIYMDDLRDELTLKDKIAAVVGPVFPSLIRSKPSHKAPGVILFTSGTEGDPKGVVLSHANIVANVEQIRVHIDLSTDDITFCPLPTFHCLGLTGGLILPLLTGMKAVLYPTPLHVKIIPQRVRKTGATLLFATDTFMSRYARSGKEGDLSSIRLAVCGAERVRDETRALVKKKYGTIILEGYGATEAAPVVAVNQPEANKYGSVGKLLPGMESRLEPVKGIEGAGQLWVRGPNVMSGYMLPSEPGVLHPPKDGWHDTGDVVSIDEDGFITIRGRVKRFAKIGGEMVSLTVVENCASAVWPDSEHAAVAVEDSKKGEQVILLTDSEEANRADLLTWAQSHGVAEISVPKKLMIVDEVPVLGSGKVDYSEATKMVRKKFKPKPKT